MLIVMIVLTIIFVTRSMTPKSLREMTEQQLKLAEHYRDDHELYVSTRLSLFTKKPHDQGL